MDTQLAQGDLPVVEKEINKKLKKKREAELRNEMISPASSVDRHFYVPG